MGYHHCAHNFIVLLMIHKISYLFRIAKTLYSRCVRFISTRWSDWALPVVFVFITRWSEWAAPVAFMLMKWSDWALPSVLFSPLGGMSKCLFSPPDGVNELFQLVCSVSHVDTSCSFYLDGSVWMAYIFTLYFCVIASHAYFLGLLLFDIKFEDR